MSAEKPFLALMMEGEVVPDDIDEFIERWHLSSGESDLPSYLGMTSDEYKLWFYDPDALSIIAFARRFDKNLRDAVNDNIEGVRLAARASDLNKIAQLQKWLEDMTSK